MLKARDVLAWFGAAALGGLVVAILGGAAQKSTNKELEAEAFVLKDANGLPMGRFFQREGSACIFLYGEDTAKKRDKEKNVWPPDIAIYTHPAGGGWIEVHDPETGTIHLSTKGIKRLSFSGDKTPPSVGVAVPTEHEEVSLTKSNLIIKSGRDKTIFEAVKSGK